MLTLNVGKGTADCRGLSRRHFVQAGWLGLGSLTLPWLLKTRAQAAAAGHYVHDKSVVLLFLGGGASHIETFNPNMDAPAPYRSVTGETKTTIPGVTIGGTFPQLAQHAKKMTLVRSFRHPVSDPGGYPAARSVGKNSVGNHGRLWAHAQDQQARWSGPLGQLVHAGLCRRRTSHGASNWPVGPSQRRPGQRTCLNGRHDGHDIAHLV